uniref:Secreted protein n=1 Tax=Mesocestoides corti TaxID=53468 RepID=A0A5K3G422_MESCO
TSDSQAVCPPVIKKLCNRLAFYSTFLAHYRIKKKKKSPLSLPLCSLIDKWHSCQHAVVVVANTFLLPFSIIVDCVCDTAIAFCLQNRIADLANLHAFKSHFTSYLTLASRRIWSD